MQIDKSVRAVERLLSEIDKTSQIFLSKTNIKCPSGCAKCCHGKNISATPLEFLPFAYNLYKQGKLEDMYWDFKSKFQVKCLLVEGDTGDDYGKCSVYEHRGVICRLFGNCSMLDKSGLKLYSACSILKSQIDDKGQFNLDLQKYAPVYSHYYMNLRAIDNNYGSMLFPVNMAIMKAMEIVYYNTRRKRKRLG